MTWASRRFCSNRFPHPSSRPLKRRIERGADDDGAQYCDQDFAQESPQLGEDASEIVADGGEDGVGGRRHGLWGGVDFPMPFSTSRTFTDRLRPPCRAGGIEGSTIDHSASVKSLGEVRPLRSQPGGVWESTSGELQRITHQ